MSAATVHPQPARPAGLPGASAPGQRIIDGYRDADGLQVTATMGAFMLEHGFRSYAEAHDAGSYEAWKAAQWDAFGAAYGLTPLARHHHREAFLDWLNARAVDHVARNAVEAA